MNHALINRLGRRGIILSLFGFAWVVLGTFNVSTDPRVPVPPVWHETLPDPWIGLSFIVTGILAIYFSARPRKKSDTTGYVAIVAMPLVLTVSYLAAFVTYIVTLGNYGWPYGIFGVLLWGAVAVALGVVASWPEVIGGDSGDVPLPPSHQ